MSASLRASVEDRIPAADVRFHQVSQTDPIPHFEAALRKQKVPQAKLDANLKSVEDEIAKAVADAREADFPAPEEAMLHVYSGDAPYAG